MRIFSYLGFFVFSFSLMAQTDSSQMTDAEVLKELKQLECQFGKPFEAQWSDKSRLRIWWYGGSSELKKVEIKNPGENPRIWELTENGNIHRITQEGEPTEFPINKKWGDTSENLIIQTLKKRCLEKNSSSPPAGNAKKPLETTD